MPVIQIDTENAVEQLLEFADELPDEKLDAFVSGLVMIIINRNLSVNDQQRDKELQQKLEDETMTFEEQSEFLDLNTKIEKLDAARLSALLELSKIQGTPLAEMPLFRIINRGLPHDFQQRYEELYCKRLDESITTIEYQELLKISKQIEQFQVNCLATLIKSVSPDNTTIKASMAFLRKIISQS